MKHSIDAGLGNSAKAALASKSVHGVQAKSSWASLNLKGPGSSKTAALTAVHAMTHGDAVNKVTYTCTGSSPCPGGTGSSGSGSSVGSGSSNGTASGGNGSKANGPGAAAPSGSAGGATGSGTGGTGASGSGSANGSSNGSGNGSSNGSGSGSGENKNVEAQIREALGSQGVTFETNSAQLTPHAQTVLDRIAQILGKSPGSKVNVAGYTDNLGGASHNLALSKARAQATRSYLASHGVAASRMVAVGYGAAHPVASNATAAGRASNRRIEFTVQGG